MVKKIRWQIAQFFEKKWWKNYLKDKEPEEYIAWKKNYWHTFLEDINIDAYQLGQPILDIGCGPAGVFIILPQDRLYAVDPLIDNYLKLKIFKTKNYPNTTFVNSSFEEFNSDQKYQTIFCLNAINHFKDIHGSFRKLAELTERKGKLILSVDAHNHSFFRRLFALIPLDVLHPHQYFLGDYERFLRVNGLIISQRKLKKKDFFFSYWILVADKVN